MSLIRGYASAPAPLSSIFSPKLFYNDEPRENADEIGARGGGFTLSNGVETSVAFSPGAGEKIRIYVNDLELTFPTSLRAAETAKKLLDLRGEVEIRHRIKVPLGTGFGTSAAAALTTLLALFRIAGRGITLQEACKIVHGLELECKTGLNSEAGFLSEGLILVLEEGAPPRVKVNSIPLPHDSMIIAVVAAPLDTSNLLRKMEKLREIEEVGDRKLAEILRKPTPENFLNRSREFAEETGLTTGKVREIFEELRRLPVIGYAQNMIGEACHALVHAGKAGEVIARLKEVFPEYRVISSEISGLIRASVEI